MGGRRQKAGRVKLIRRTREEDANKKKTQVQLEEKDSTVPFTFRRILYVKGIRSMFLSPVCITDWFASPLQSSHIKTCNYAPCESIW